MDAKPLAKLVKLAFSQREHLERAGITTVEELLLLSASQLVQRCNITPPEADSIIDTVCEELAPRLRTLDDPGIAKDLTFTTGDRLLDNCLGGGITTGKIWEIFGQGSAGKSQLCMQISLSVQLPRSRGGIASGACFLSTSWTLAAYERRIAQMIDGNPNLSPSQCGLSAVEVISTPSVPDLTKFLSKDFPYLVESRAKQPFAKPIRLLIIDALAGLYHTHQVVDNVFLRKRSRELAIISSLLHRLISKYGLAVVVVNEVADVINRLPPVVASHEVLYADQERLFSSAKSIPGENKKQAALGLSWAHQINARIMLSRTDRTRCLEQSEMPAKRRRLNSGEAEPREDQPTLIRRLTVIFNPLAPPASVDYIITMSGIEVLPTEDASSFVAEAVVPQYPPQVPMLPTNAAEGTTEISPSDFPLEEATSSQPSSDPQLPSDGFESSQPAPVAADAEDGPQEAEDEWAAIWVEMDAEIPSDCLRDIDTDHLTSSAPPVRAAA